LTHQFQDSQNTQNRNRSNYHDHQHPLSIASLRRDPGSHTLSTPQRRGHTTGLRDEPKAHAMITRVKLFQFAGD